MAACGVVFFPPFLFFLVSFFPFPLFPLWTAGVDCCKWETESFPSMALPRRMGPWRKPTSCCGTRRSPTRWCSRWNLMLQVCFQRNCCSSASALLTLRREGIHKAQKEGWETLWGFLHFLFSLVCTEVAGSSDPFINVLCSLLGWGKPRWRGHTLNICPLIGIIFIFIYGLKARREPKL